MQLDSPTFAIARNLGEIKAFAELRITARHSDHILPALFPDAGIMTCNRLTDRAQAFFRILRLPIDI